MNSCPPEPELEPEPAWEKIVGAGAALKVDGSETLLTWPVLRQKYNVRAFTFYKLKEEE